VGELALSLDDSFSKDNIICDLCKVLLRVIQLLACFTFVELGGSSDERGLE